MTDKIFGIIFTKKTEELKCTVAIALSIQKMIYQKQN